MSERKPTFKPEVNKPVDLELIKMFKSGTHDDGHKWYGWGIKLNGQEFNLFADDQLQSKIDGCAGTVVKILLKEVRQDGKKPYRIWEVGHPLFDEKGGETPEPPPNLATNPEAYQTFRDEWKKKFREAIDDAYDVLAEYNANPLYEMKFTAEDVRTAAISRMIDYNRKTK